MKKGGRSWRGILMFGLVLVAAAGVLLFVPDEDDRVGNPDRFVSADFWQGFASPGELSQAHAFLETNCISCHVPVDGFARGLEAATCIACHANNEPLLQRQPTAFHADADRCGTCHIEHGGVDARPTAMDHAVLTRIGLSLRSENALLDNKAPSPSPAPSSAPSPSPSTSALAPSSPLPATLRQVQQWIRTADEPAAHDRFPLLTRQERVLDCAACHTLDDRHFGLFGLDCATCHSASTWDIPTYRHPPSTNVECAQCHQAPPSHYMKHYEMVSQTVANQPDARVDQCYLCHQSTAWPDIKGIGWYKHH